MRSRRARFRFALVGAGRMGQTHLRALADHPELQITDIAEVDGGARSRLSAAGYRAHSSLEDLLLRARPDGLLVAVPTAMHLSVIKTGVAAGIPILCEKPAGLTSGDVALAGQLAAHGGVPLQVAYWRRHVPTIASLRKRIQTGALGDVHLIIALQWDRQPPQAQFRARSGGLFVDMGVHELDQIQWLTGKEITSLESVASKPAGGEDLQAEPDSAQALLTLSGGTSAIISLGRHYPRGDMAAVEVFGTLGHERLAFLDPVYGHRTLRRALRRQAEAFAICARTGSLAGARVDDAVAALRWAECATGLSTPATAADLF